MLRNTIVPLALIGAAAAVPSVAPGAVQEGARTEAARIERRLERLEARVLVEDAKLRRMDQALGAELLAAMERASPGVGDDARRLAAIRSTAAAGGRATHVSAAEMRRLEARVDAARSAAVRDGRLASAVEAFSRLLRKRLVRSDPEAGHLLARYAELQP